MGQPDLGRAARATDEGGAGLACRVEGLSKSYRTGFWGRRQPAVRDIAFDVPRGAITGLLGHNGAGKTTTLKAILDLVRPDAGRITLLGRDHRDRRARSSVGYLPEGPYFYDYLTGAELLDFYGRLCDLPARERARRAREVLGLVGMAEHARTPLRKCSKGMLQRLGLAQAMLHDPQLLILDEPMSGLDPLGRKEVRDLLGELRARGRTILLSSHIVPDLEALADRVVMLQRGRLAGVHELRGAPSPRFEVWLAALPDDARAAPLWAGGAAQPAAGGRGGWTVVLSDLPRLRVLLDLAAAEGIAVHAVNSRQTSLEETFLSGLRETPAAGAARPERERAPADVTASAAQTVAVALELARVETAPAPRGEPEPALAGERRGQP